MKEQICRISPETRRILSEVCYSGKAVELWACDLSGRPAQDAKANWPCDAYAFALKQGSRWVELELVMPPEGDEEWQTFMARESESGEPWAHPKVFKDFRGQTVTMTWQKIARWDMPVEVELYQDRVVLKGTQDESQHELLVDDVAISFGCCGARWILQHAPWYRICLLRKEEDMLDGRDSWPYVQDWLVSFQREKHNLV